MQHQKLQTSTFNQEQSFFLAFLLMSARQFPIDPCNPRPHRVATTGHHEPATADPFRCSLSLSEICWESQWSGCFGMFSTCICQAAKDDKTAFLNCLNYLILGSRQTNQACGFRERVLSSRSSETFPYLSTSKASPLEMTSPIWHSLTYPDRITVVTCCKISMLEMQKPCLVEAITAWLHHPWSKCEICWNDME